MDFQYVSRPVKGAGCSGEWEEVLQGCDCDGPCTAENNCTCILGNESNYDGSRLADKFSNKPILECHFECSCNTASCSNRVLQKGVSVQIKVVQIGCKGYGIKAMEFIPMNTFVCEYAGEIIGEEEANRRFMTNKTEHNYIMTVKETCLEKTVAYYIDPREKGNLARFLNHSCEPNLYQMPVRVGCPIPRMAFFALKLRKDMARHKKIPTKSRKKLKACDPFNTNVKSWKVKAIRKKSNRGPNEIEAEQPLSQNLRELQKSLHESNDAVVKKRTKKKNKALIAAEKMGIFKRRFEDMKTFLRRVDKTVYRSIEEHKIKMEQGIAARPQNEIDEELKYLEEKEKTQKDNKRREIQNKIKKAKKEKEAEANNLALKVDRRNSKYCEQNADIVEPEESATDEEDNEDAELSKHTRNLSKKKEPIFGIPKKPPVNEAIINRKEKVAFGERYDEPPQFSGLLKSKLGRLTAKAGEKPLLLHSVLRKSTTKETVYLETESNQKATENFERQRVIEAYRNLKRNKTGTALPS